MRNGLSAALLAVAPTFFTVPPVAGSIVDVLNFSTTGQGLWKLGTDPADRASFDLTIFDETLPKQTVAAIATTVTVPNPARPVYEGAFAGCRAAGGSVEFRRALGR